MDQTFIDRYTTQSLAAADSLGIAESSAAAVAATVVDIGTSLWNSAVVGLPKLLGADTSSLKASTFDILDSVNTDWSNFYRQHTGAIETASFIGGSLIPASFALKGMRALQAGKLLYYPEMMKDVTQTARITQLGTLMKNGSGATSEFQALRWQILGVDALQQTSQMVGMEVAIIATMNEHAWFDDYFKDPVKNFAISIATGSVIGSAFSQPVVRKQLRDYLGPIETAAMKGTTDKLLTIPYGLTDVAKVQMLKANADQLASAATDQGTDQLTRDIAAFAKQRFEGAAAEMEKLIMSPEILKLSPEVKLGVREFMYRNETFGANRISQALFSENAAEANTKFAAMFKHSGKAFEELEANSPELFKLGKLQQQGLVASSELQKILPNWKTLMEENFGIYHSPHFDAWLPLEGKVAQQYTRAVDMGITSAPTVNVIKPTADAFEGFMNRNTMTAIADKRWLSTLQSAAKADLTGLKQTVTIAADDLPGINAWISRGLSDAGVGVEKPVKFLLQGEKGVTAEASLEDLVQHLSSQKEKLARELLDQGAGFQEMSIRLNTDVETIQKFFLKGESMRNSVGWRQYVDSASIEKEYLSQSGRMLKLTTNGQHVASLRFRNTDMSINLDQKFLKQTDRGVILNVIQEVKSPQMQDLFLALHASDKLWDTIGAEVSNVVNAKLGTSFFSSTEFATRGMGDLTDIASALGQAQIGRNNTQAKALFTPLSAVIHSHTQTQAGLNEVNAIFNHLAGFSGYRNYDPLRGELYKRVGFDEAGKEIREVIKASDISGVIGADLSSGAKAILKEMKDVSEAMYKVANTVNRIHGFRDLENIGLHIPTFNANNKFLAYIIDTTTQDPNLKVRLLIGKSPEELASLAQRWLKENTQDGIDILYHTDLKMGGTGGKDLVLKGDQAAYNAVRMRVDPTQMDFAAVNKFHSGASASALPITNDLLTSTLIENLHDRFLHYSRKVQEMYLHDTMATLDVMSEFNQRMVKDQPIRAKYLGTFQPDDAARTVKNMILGNSQLGEHTTWQTFNNSFSATVDYVSNKWSKLSGAFSKEVTPGMPLGGKDWVKHSKELEKMGVVNPFKGYDDYLLSKSASAPIKESTLSYTQQIEQLKIDAVARLHSVDRASAAQIIAAGNSVISTLALRMLETGQPFINALSMPILGIPELMRNLPKTYLGNEITAQGVGVTFPVRTIYDGVRFRWSDASLKARAQWAADGFSSPIVSEASQMQSMIYKEGRGTIGKINTMMNAKDGIISKLSWASDSIESETRVLALSVGYQAARTAYPTITHQEAMIFSERFMTRVIGNYHAAQRPALFQGTAGVALGLFQTYMLSWGQSLYRSIEEGARGPLAAQMLIQAGLFGTSSLPGYDLFSKTIASHFSDKHYDLTTGTYRALPNGLAELVVYGLPASMGVGLYTRGDLQPRIPVVSQNSPLDQIAAVNVMKQFYGFSAHAMTKVLDAQGLSGKSRALLEGLSMQSMSRPIARIAEIIPMPDPSSPSGVSAVGALSREGNTIATSSEVWSTPGLMSRILSSRSAEEQVKREIDYMASFHATLDTGNRKRTTESLKTAVRSGTLGEEGVLDHIAGQYLRWGTATGWHAAVNEALATSSGGVDYKLEKRLKANSPLQQMINGNF